MSKSVRALSVWNCTGFTAKVNSEEGIVRQNARLYTACVMRLLLICLILCVLPSISVAQPGVTGAWNADNVGVYGAGPGGALTGAGGVNGRGQGVNNGRPGWWEVQGDLIHGGTSEIRYLSWLDIWGSLYVNGGRSIFEVTQISVGGDLSNAGTIRDGNLDTGNNYGGYIAVGGTLWNTSVGTGAVGDIINFEQIVAGRIENQGSITNNGQAGGLGDLYISTTSDLVNGYTNTDNPGQGAGLISANAIYLSVDGNLENRFNGSIVADLAGWTDTAGYINVGGQLYNAGEITVVGNSVFNQWQYLWAGSLYNDGRLYSQGGAWNDLNRGIIQDFQQIVVDGDLTNIGRNAVINGAVVSDTGKYMHVSGNLYNMDRASIFNYSTIIVHGDLTNRGATLVGGHWNSHVHTNDGTGIPGNPAQQYQTGHIGVWGNVYNISEKAGASGETFGGLIASFDLFQVHGSLFNDVNSMITGTYDNVGTGPGGLGGFITIPDPDNPNGTITVPAPFTTIGRRANVINGVLIDGEMSDAASVLTVKGVFSDEIFLPGAPPISGLYNEGHIREIDIINVGVDESTVLWNAYATRTPGSALPTSNGETAYPEGPIGTPSTITDIGVINTTNLINSGTISDIDVAINVSYMLWNDIGGTLDGYSPSQVQWTYYDNPDSILHGEPLFWTAVPVETYADLNVGRAGIGTPMELLLGVSGLEGIGIVNYGTIMNFDTISSQGDVLNYGVISGVASVSIGSNRTPADRADFYNVGSLLNVGSVYVSGDMQNYGALMNVEGVRVSGDLLLGTGSSFGNVGTVAAQNNVLIDGTIDGGFRVLSAETGGITVGGAYAPIPGLVPGLVTSSSLTIDLGATAAANTFVENYGTIVNNGVLNSAGNIENWGTLTNNGVISAYNIVRNQGLFSGNGVVSLNANNGVFDNVFGGVIVGGHVINGNFRNTNGDIVVAPNEAIRVVNGTATINRGTVDGSALINPEVGKQYLFLAADKPGDLFVERELKGIGSGDTGSILDFTPVYGYWDGIQYVPGKEWSRNNQFYWLEVKRAYSYGAHAVTENQIAVGNYIDTIGTAPTRNGGLWNLLAQLDGISDDPSNPYYHPDYRAHQGLINPAALRALDEMSGMIYANLGAAAVHNSGVINRTLADVLRSDVFKFSYIGNPNNAIRGQAIAPLRYSRWGTLFGIGGNSQHDGNADGYRTSFGGVMAGFDRALWTGTRVGAYLSAAVGDVSMRELDEKSDTTSASVGMYLRQEMYYGYGLAAAGFGMDWYDTERNLTMLNHRAESKTNAKIGTVYLERGIDIPVYYATLQPYTSFQVVSVHQDRFTERMYNPQGLYSDIGLEGVKGRTDSFKLALGTRAASQPIPLPWGQLALTGNMAWFHDFNGKGDRDFIARFANPGGNSFGAQYSDLTFRIDGNDPKRDWFNFGLGLNMDRNSTRAFLGADLYANSRQTMFSGNLGFITSW